MSAEGFMRAGAMAHRSYENASFTRSIAGCERFFILIQSFDASCAIGSVFAFRDQALEAELACLAEEIRSDSTLLERADEDAVRPAC